MLELRQLDISLREMVYMYEIKLDRTNTELRSKVAERAPKERLLMLLRRRSILHSYLAQSEKRMTICTQKQCALEQLQVTQMQLQAIRNTSRIFKRFTKRNTVERVEALHETMCELQDDMMDISEILEQPVCGEVDVEEELAELMEEELYLPVTPVEPPQVQSPQVQSPRVSKASGSPVAERTAVAFPI